MGFFLVFVSTLLAVFGHFAIIAIFHFSTKFSADIIPGKTLFVIGAHPDDEVMFFGPSILRSESPYILCISKGVSVGNISRSQELQNPCKALGIEGKCFIDEEQNLPDGFEYMWERSEVRSIINKYVNMLKPDRIVTFDQFGVSGHPNHVAVSLALTRQKVFDTDASKNYNHSISEDPIDQIPIYKLNSKPSLVKYMGPYSIIIYLMFYKSSNGYFIVTPPKDHFGMKIENAFLQHSSQIVWYRFLWLAFSRFLIFNQLVPDVASE